MTIFVISVKGEPKAYLWRVTAEDIELALRLNDCAIEDITIHPRNVDEVIGTLKSS